MPTLTYPGVYIEEAPGGPPPIAGVATSIAAFIGWTNQGPVGESIMVESWAQYQSMFGGLIPGVYLGYAVYQFFQNGGSQALIVRLYDSTSAKPTVGTVGGLALTASNPGKWGDGLCIGISAVTPQADGSSTFNLQVYGLSPSGGATLLESFTGLSNAPSSPQWVVTVIDNDSSHIAFQTPVPTTQMAVTATPAAWIAAGRMTAGSFTSGDTVTQTGTSFTSTTLGVATTPSSGFMILSAAPTGGTGTVSSSGAWTSGASSFAPTTTPVQLPVLPLVLGTGGTSGNDGATLMPNTGAFLTELLNTQTPPAPVTGVSALTGVTFNILCVPGESSAAAVPALQSFCTTNRAFLIVDADPTATIGNGTSADLSKYSGPVDGSGLSLVDQYAANSAFYFPWVQAPDPAAGYRPAYFPPCGFVAGIYAATDASRGVWKAPAGVNTGLTGVLGLQYVLSDAQNGQLNPNAINCLRQLPTYGAVVWGARTMAGSDAAGSQWKYVPIRRFALFLESSLYQGTQWAVFEPNAAPLWSAVRLSIGAFMQGLFLQGAFAGTTPPQAYFVKCDADNNPPASVALGVLNITVGFAPLYPAEFVVITIQQMTQS
jgi:phage tail sheath protein FI